MRNFWIAFQWWFEWGVLIYGVKLSFVFLYGFFVFRSKFKVMSKILTYVKVVGFSPSKKKLFVCFNDSPSKMMKNAFYLILKALFILKRYLNFVLTFWASRNNGLIRKIRLISELMTSQLGQQKITTNILLNISRTKENQTIKFGQLREHSKRNIFL